MGPDPLRRFLARAVLWFPFCLALWYWQAEWFNAPAALASGMVMIGLFPDWLVSAEWSQRVLSVLTRLELINVPVPVERQGQVALMAVRMNALTYGYGLPLFAALLLASEETKRWRKLFLGGVILIPFQIGGICFHVLRQIVILGGPAVSAQAGFDTWRIQLILLGHQFFTLILVPVGPIALWLAFNRQFIPILLLDGWIRSGVHPEEPVWRGKA